MADEKQRMTRGNTEPSSRIKPIGNVPGRHVLGVDFQEMNFEQRRAPYNSGTRTIVENEFDVSHKPFEKGSTLNENTKRPG